LEPLVNKIRPLLALPQCTFARPTTQWAFNLLAKGCCWGGVLDCAMLGTTVIPGTALEVAMLTRRDFAGVASCAICAVAGFAATEALAQGNPPAATPGLTRKILFQQDGPTPGYVTIIAEAEIEPSVMIARHTHPGIESAYVLEGGLDLAIEGQPTRPVKAGDAFMVPPNTPHAGGKNGDKKTKIAVTYIVEKGKPLASPA
jgi:quercetin dioxygenase-like cupin family protein